MTESGQKSPEYIDLEVIQLTANGIWIADGSEITHEPTRKLFSRSLKKDSEGYFLSIGRETKRISVVDTAYFVERIEIVGKDLSTGLCTLSLSDGSQEKLDPATLSYREGPSSSGGRLTCKIKASTKDSGEEAKFLRAPYHELLGKLEQSNGSYLLQINGQKIKLAPYRILS